MYGNVIEDYDVTFEVYAGGGYIFESQPVKTDLNGIAAAHWVLGPSLEVNRSRARADGLQGSPVEYIATGKPGTPTTLLALPETNQQVGIAGRMLPKPLTVQVVDNNGDPIGNYKVRFKVDFGDGNFNRESAADMYTDVFGYAKGYFVLGRVAGSNIASVEAPQLTGSPKRFTAMGTAGPAEKVIIFSGDGSTIAVNGSRWLSVKVTDIYDNAVANYSISFAVIIGDATIQSGYETVTSDADGIASTLIKAGSTLGEVKVLILAPELIGDGMIFTLQIGARPAVSMSFYHGNGQIGTIGRELVYPLSIIVKDDLGNPAGSQNIPITFALTGDYGILLDQVAYSDQNGIASARLQLQEATGNVYKVWAINNNLHGSPLEFTATGVTNKFPLISEIPLYSVEEDKAIIITIKASDEDGDAITYGVRNLPYGASFDSTSSHQFSWKPNFTQAGTHIVHFMAWDNKGGFDDQAATIEVENVNRLPQIINYEPIAYQIVGHLNIGEIFRFMVQVSDADGETPTYHWYNDDLLVSMKNYYDCKVSEQGVGGHIVKVEVSDGYDTIEHDWVLSVKTPVELANFSGKVLERMGIELSWETTAEANNAGFNIYRRSAKDIEYEKINFTLITPAASRQYTYIDRNVKVGEYYKYKLEDVTLTGEKAMHEPIEIFVTKPEKYELAQNYPNPFNSSTYIRYQLPEQNHVTIRIYNLLGQEVITLANEIKEAGYHSLIWDGVDKNGNLVGSGVYYYRIESALFVQTKKMVLLK